MSLNESNLSISDTITLLKEVIGLRLLAIVVVSTTQTIQEWQDGKSDPSEDQKTRLYQISDMVQTLREANESDCIIKAFFIGNNPDTNDQPPVLAIREDQFDVAWAAVLNLAGE